MLIPYGHEETERQTGGGKGGSVSFLLSGAERAEIDSKSHRVKEHLDKGKKTGAGDEGEEWAGIKERY